MITRLASTKAISLNGIAGSVVNVEASISSGLASFVIVGLPDTSVSESKSRVISALRSCGISFGEMHITVNLAPASVPKRGSSFDLSIAVAIVGANKQLDAEKIKNYCIIGELGLDGRIHPVNGVLPIVLAAKKANLTNIIVPTANAQEAGLIDGLNILSFGHIYEVVNYFGGKVPEIEYDVVSRAHYEANEPKLLDFADVLGQEKAKRSLEIAAAGFHNVLMVGPPGTGKSMLASRMPSIMPQLDTASAIEVTSVYSICGRGNTDKLITIPPFEAPHHTATAPAIIGGGSGLPKPGSVSKAHNGVLFLDEAPEFSPRVLQTLRQPLESGTVTIDRSGAKASYPANFQLIMACNPCPCGYGSSSMLNGNNGNLDASNDDVVNSVKCKCSSLEQRRYLARLSGPLLDRVDIFTDVQNIKSEDISGAKPESSSVILERVGKARNRARKRLENTPWQYNSQIPGSYLRKILIKDPEILNSVMKAIDLGVISMRGADRLLRVCLTIADLKGKDTPDFEDISEAMELKGGMNG